MNKIGWCDMTFNPVWGCRNHCEYCYARRMAKRFYDVIGEKEYYYMQYKDEICQGEFANRLRHFVPTFIYSQFNKKLPKKPQRIFVGSMSEIYYWKDEWIEMVIEKVKQYPQHTFQFLTKHPEVYADWVFPENCWLGITVTTNLGLYETDFITNSTNERRIKFICLEPMLNEVEPSYITKNIDWIIIGAETGNRKDKIIPKREWIENIVNYCIDEDIPIYLKDNLKNIYPSNIKEFPEEVGL